MSRGKATGVASALIACTLVILAFALTASAAGSGAGATTCGGSTPGRPSVSGTRAVWSDFSHNQWDIWLYDAAAGSARQLSSGPGDKIDPVISGNTILFTWYHPTTGADIYMYDLASGQTTALDTRVGDQFSPTVSGHWAAWRNYDYTSMYSNSQIIYYDLTGVAAPAPVTASNSSNPGGQDSPRIGGDWLVYRQNVLANASMGKLDSDVYAFNLVTHDRIRISGTSFNDLMPVTDGSTVAFVTVNPATGGSDIWTYNLATHAIVKTVGGRGEQTLPEIGGGMLFWTDAAQKQPLVIGKNLSGGATQPLNPGAPVTGFVANGNARAWLQLVSGHWVVKAQFAPVGSASLARSSAMVPLGAAWASLKPPTLSTPADTVAPKVVSTSVKPGQRSVSRTATFRVGFSESMNPDVINNRTVQLFSAKNRKPVTARVTYSPLSHTAIVAPVQPLGSGTYTLEVAPTVADAAGNTVNNMTQVSFSTNLGAPQTSLPPGECDSLVARTISTTQVVVSWDPAVDDVGVASYNIYRQLSATAGAGFALIGSVAPQNGNLTGQVATVSVGTTEAAARFTLYYTVKAVDTDGQESQVWLANVPCPHGTAEPTIGSSTCLLCHQIHGGMTGVLGVFGSGSPTLCYRCHGSTSATSTYGYGSVNNVQAQFYNYPNAPLSDGMSVHGNAYIRAQADDAQCDMCHSPHRLMYSDTPALGHRSLLHEPSVTNTSVATLLSVDSAPFGTASLSDRTQFCYNCHGSGVNTATAPLGYMATNGGPTAYDNTAGDHNQANWTNGTAAIPPTVPYQTAHGSYLLTDAARGSVSITMAPPNGGRSPINDCQVCHVEHGSAGPALLAYRRQAPASNAQVAQSAMCFNCHSGGAAADTPTSTSRATRPNDDWNGRDVKAQFTNYNNGFTNVSGNDQWSHHVYVSNSRSYASASNDSAFTGYTLTNLVVVGGNAQLAAGQSVGTLVSPLFSPSGTVNRWVSCLATGGAPANTQMTVEILDSANNVIAANPQWNGSSWYDGSVATITAGQTNALVPLVTISPVVYPTLKVRVTFYGTSSATPFISLITMNWQSTSSLNANSLTCYNCHNVHFVGVGGSTAWDYNRYSEPTDTNQPNPGQTSTDFCLGCHDVQSGSPVGMGARLSSAGQFVPYPVYFSAPYGSTFFTGWNKTKFTSSGHFTTTGTKALCQNCHDPHASNWDNLIAWTTPQGYNPAVAAVANRSRDNTDAASQESNLCFNCHGNGSVVGGYQGAQCATGASNFRPDVATPMSGQYGHNGTVIARTDLHSDMETAGALGKTNRHAECVDCHNPHEAQAGTHTVGTSIAAKVLNGVYGEKPAFTVGTSWTAPASWSSLVLSNTAGSLEAYLCLKCHSSYIPNWASQPATAPSGNFKETDVALEFNPNNMSGHNVLGPDSNGKYWSKSVTKAGSTWTTSTSLSFVSGSGWSTMSQMTCTDCHTTIGSDARGPHGSTALYGLRWGGTNIWYKQRTSGGSGGWGGGGGSSSWDSSTLFCAGCHNENHASWVNRDNAHDATCETCHVRIPHGWKRPRLLAYHGNGGDQLPYSDPNVSGLTGVSLRSYNDAPTSENDCGTNCGDHGSVGTKW